MNEESIARSQIIRPVAALTVTYGSRHHLCVRTVRAALEAGAEHVFVVLNGASNESRDAIREQASRSTEITLIELAENLGSAGGFAVGLRSVPQQSFGSVWLLDDDNVCDPTSLDELVARRARVVADGDCDDPVMLSHRKDNRLQDKAISARSASAVYPPSGSFMSFDLFHRISSPRQGGLGTPQSGTDHGAPIEVPYGPYGGLLVSTSALSVIGYPDEKLTLYEDDTEYTARLSEHGYKVFLCPESGITDIDGKWSEDNDALTGPQKMLAANSSVRRYYAVRNRVRFDTARAVKEGRLFSYRLNKLVYMTYLLSAAVRMRKVSAFAEIRRAARHGRRGEYGLGPELAL